MPIPLSSLPLSAVRCALAQGGEVAGRVLVVACVRVLGCFLAQMPECFAGRVRALLEHMLCAGGAVGAEGEPVAFLLPFLRQARLPTPTAHTRELGGGLVRGYLVWR